MITPFRLAAASLTTPALLTLALIALAHPIQAGFDTNLVAYWKFDNSLTDETATGADGTFSGTAPIAYTAAKFGNGIDLDGIDQHVVVDQVAASTFDFGTAGGGTGNVTVSAWFATGPWDGTSWQALIAKGESSNWRVARRGTTDNLAYAGGSGDIFDGGYNVNGGGLHHVVAITEGGVSTRIWIDGVLRATGGAPNVGTQNAKFMMIGNNPDSPGRSWAGVIDDVAIWDRVLSDTEIGQIWNGGAGESIETLLTIVDTDNDGLSDTEENTPGADGFITNPNNPDTDGDGVGDAIDTDPTVGTNDNDSDGLSNADETNGTQNPWTGSTLGTAPGDSTDPLVADSDGDGILDGEEVIAGTDTFVTNPNAADTDGDAVSDSDEIANGWDPTDPLDPPSLWPAGLIGYWPFDGNFVEAEGTGRDGTLNGTAAATFTAAKFGQGIDLDGVDQYVELGLGAGENASLYDPPTGDVSISAWIRVDAFDESWQALIAKGEGNSWRIARYQNTNNLGYAGGSGDVQNGQNVNDGGFHHVVAVTEGGVETRLYVDGVKVVGGSPTLASNGLLPTVGANLEGGGRHWTGVVDELAIWNRPLSDTEVATIYNGGTGTEIADLLNPDADGDGMDDDWEILHFGDTSRDGTGDFDGDLLSDLNEFNNNSNPTIQDTDGDGSNDLAEFTNGTDPNDTDTDDDGLTDGQEIANGTNGLLADTDGDGLTDSDEVLTQGTNATLADTDGDGAGDGLEILLGTDPLSNASTPPPGMELVGLTSPGSVNKFLNANLPADPPGGLSSSNWQTEDFFTGQGNFADLKGLAPEPNSTFLAVVERQGTVQRVDAGDRASTGRQQILDLGLDASGNGDYGDNGGLRSVAFHPQINTGAGKDYMYVFYSLEANASNPGFTTPYETYPGTGQDYFFYRVSRFTRNPSTGVYENEFVMIQQMTRDRGQHFGGGLTFDKDGMLVITWGDTEFSGGRVSADFYQDNQRVDRIFQAAVLRIDVDMQGGAVSHAPTRTLQGNTGPQAMPGTSQSCDPTHHYYHKDNYSGVGYFIPDDNFFVLNPPPAGTAGTTVGATGDTTPGVNYPAHGAALEEHHALGLRNPWRATCDPVSGDIAIFVVGSNQDPKSEEIKVMKPAGGENFGWAYREGDHLKANETGRTLPPGGDSYAPVYLGTETDPAAFWEHTSGNGSVASGGLYYRGTQWPSVGGRLIGADHGSGKIWSIDYLAAGAASSTNATTGGVQHPDNFTVELMLDTSLAIRQMSASPDGEEILIAANGNIWRLYNAAAPNPDPPMLLSETGAFTDVVNLVPAPGMVRYEPEAPLWSDRSLKPRWMSVPNSVAGDPGVHDDPSEKITFSENGEWVFPKGTVFVKHFTLPLDERDPLNPALQKRLETRFVVKSEDNSFYYFTYKWNASDTEATLIPAGDTSAYDEIFTVTGKDGNDYTQTWKFPSRAQCAECHQIAAGSVLGVKTRQLNNMFTYPSSGMNAHQLATLNNLGLFDQPLTASAMPNYMSSARIDDATATLEHRVHSYLDSNCSMCHRPGAVSGLAVFDARLTTPMALTGIINGIPKAGDLGISGAEIVKPRDPSKSLLWVRDGLVGANQMPPLAKEQNHDEYMAVLTDWIGRLGLTNFDAWANNLGITNGVPADDFDNDGMSDGLEFLLQLDGSVPNPAGNYANPNGANKQFAFPLSGDALADGFVPIVEDCNDLVSWVPAGGPGSILTPVSDTSSPGTDGIMTWQFIPGSRGFARIGTVTPPPAP